MAPGTVEPLHLLLAHADNGAPVVDRLKLDLAHIDPLAGPGAPSVRRTLYDAGADPNDLAAQGWGLLVPEHSAEAVVEALAPLIAHREQQLASRCKIYRVPPAMDWSASRQWCAEIYQSVWMPEEIPRYLLLAGDLDAISLELQQTLSYVACVGRLAFDSWADYTTYAGKVIASETTPRDVPPILGFYAAADETAATEFGRSRLIQPCWNMARIRHMAKRLPVRAVKHLSQAESPAKADLLATVASAERQVLVSLAHGCGAPGAGWGTERDQRMHQGSIALGRGEILTAEDAATEAFLPHGVWMSISCFSAGTPAQSAYVDWFRSMASGGLVASQLERALPLHGRPFVSAVAKAALANPNGPLAVFGYIDLAWLYGLVAPGNPLQSRADRFYRLAEQLCRSRRFGVALDDFHRDLRAIDAELLTRRSARESAPANEQKSTAETMHQRRAGADGPQLRLHLQMTREDLRGYTLVGDPAAHI